MTTRDASPVSYRTHRVFVPGDTSPTVTYNPRDDANYVKRVKTYIERSGEILVVAGPTKMGKTVLVRRAIPENRQVWLEGSWLHSIDDFWSRIAAVLHIPKTTTGAHESVRVEKWQWLAKLGFSSFAGVETSIAGEESASNSAGWIQELPQDQAVSQALRFFAENSDPFTIVIDDFHFAPPEVRTEVIRALKALVSRRVPAILITLGHRRRDASAGVRDIGGRVATLFIDAWEVDELAVIAQKGFAALGLVDLNESLGRQIASESYGSPQIMQSLCLELCDVGGTTSTHVPPVRLAPPSDWPKFYRSVRDEQAIDWLEKLVGGAKPRGQQRLTFKLRDGSTPNGYELLLAAMKMLGPSLTMPAEDIRNAAAQLLHPDTRADNDGTKKLIRMSKIAATSMDRIPTEDELDTLDLGIDLGDRQPVFEYIEDTPTPTVYIVEPFLAYSLRWFVDDYLPRPPVAQNAS